MSAPFASLNDSLPSGGETPVEVDSLARIRHDLRTPVSHIQGYAEILQEEANDAGCPEILPDLKRIEEAGRRLVEIIREELAPERMGSGRIDLRHLHSELRTPLNHAIGYSEMLMEVVERRNAPGLLRDLQKIHDAAHVFLKLMSELLIPTRLMAASEHRPAVTAAARPDALALSRGPPASAPALELLPQPAKVMVVDDDPENRDLLRRRLARQGFEVVLAEDGPHALRIARQEDVDLILLDLIMPGMDGDRVLAELKADPRLNEIPVIMLSALDEMDAVVRCILMGAEDYLSKPFNTVLLRARLNACMEKRRLRLHEQEYLRSIESERQKSESLLLNILPRVIADRLKQGETTIVDSLGEVTLLFADIVGFTDLAGRLSSVDLVRLLDDIFSGFDTLAEAQCLEKIKTIGDAYMVVGGLPIPRIDHAAAVAELALNMLEQVDQRFGGFNPPIRLRLGMNSGPVIAGIIGRHKFNYDLWGDTVNTASRMESHSLPGRIQVTESTYQRLHDKYLFEPRGVIEVKGKGPMRTWFLTGRRTPDEKRGHSG
jgi:class 3 adenylate cyclase